ncbi:hypothetical protein ACU9CW_003072 [Cronobacter dublinensis]
MRYLAYALFFFCNTLYAQSVPKFDNYSIKDVYRGPVAPLRLSDDQKNHLYGEYLYAAENSNKVNYAGHYILFIYGCGGGALCAGVKDAKNGHLLETGTDAYDASFWNGATFKINSSLLEISGKTFENNFTATDFFVFEKDELKKIHSQKDD